MWKSIKYILIFLIIQVLAIFLLYRIGYKYLHFDYSLMLNLSIFISFLVSSIYFAYKIPLNKECLSIHPWTIILFTILATCFFILPESDIVERLNLPFDIGKSNLNDLVDALSKSIIGIISICIIGPISEEFLFRGVVLKSLLKWKPIMSKPWIAILLSAFFFSLMHGNPAQGFGAFLSGTLYGWLAYRTGSLLPGLVGHIINNSTLIILTNTLNKDIETFFSELFSSPIKEFGIIGASAVLCAITVVILVRVVNNNYEPKERYEKNREIGLV